MQIQKISQSNPSFGYNPELNARLVYMLENTKKNKAYSTFLRDMCVVTNNAEIELRDAEIKGKRYLRSMLISAFLPVKIAFTNLINDLYPQFNYRAKELESYDEEIKEYNIKEDAPGHWLNILAENLREYEKQDKYQNLNTDMHKFMNRIQKKYQDINLKLAVVNSDTHEVYDDSFSCGEISENNDPEANDINKRIINGKTKVVEFVPQGAALKGFDGLGGMQNIKTLLNKLVIRYLKHPNEMRIISKAYGVSLPDAILLYGPPGTGKSTVVEHMSVEGDTALLKLKPGIFGSKYVSGNQQNLEAAFDYAASIATEDKPVILFIDDVDTVIGSRDRHVSDYKEDDLGTFLDRIQNAHKENILVVAATNKYNNMDPAVLRRFTEQVFVGLPDQEARESIIRYYLSGDECSTATSLLNDNEAITRIAQKMEEFPISLIRTTMLKAKSIPHDEAADNMILNGKIELREVTEEDINKILPLPEIQAQKVKEDNYQNNASRKSIGFPHGGKMLI